MLGNGAGSFAHPSAAKYKTKEGFINANSKYGACVVQNDAVAINRIVINGFLKKKIPVMGVSPHDLILSSSGKLKSIWLEPIIYMLKKEIIPVVHGDVIIDGRARGSLKKLFLEKEITGTELTGWSLAENTI